MAMIESLPFTVIDYVALAYLAFGLVRGMLRGLAGELARLAGVGLAVLAGWHLYEPVGEKINEATRLTGQDSYLAGFLLTCAAVWMIMALARWGMKELMELTFKPLLNRLGGAGAGFLRCALLLSALFIAMGLCRIDYLRTKFTEDSVVGSQINEYLLPVYVSMTEERPELRPGVDKPADDDGDDQMQHEKPSLGPVE